MKDFLLFAKTLTINVLMLVFITMVPSLYAANYELDSAITYNFEDISTTGTILLENCDDCARAVDIGFDFTYYGRVYSQLYVSANGFVLPGGSAPLLGGRMGCCAGRDLPEADTIVGIMALWWTDLSLKAQEDSSAKEENGKIYVELTGSPGTQVLIVQYDQVRHFHNLATDDANTFQLKIFESDNHIEFHYKNLVANPNIHTIGIESPAQDQAKTFFLSSKKTPLPSKTQEFALSFIPPEAVKLTSSLRYGAEGNFLEHKIEVEQEVQAINQVTFSESEEEGFLTDDIDFDNVQLLTTNPAQFSLVYTLDDSVNQGEGSISEDLLSFQIDSEEELSVISQTVFIQQAKLLENQDFTTTDAAVNDNGTIFAFKSKDNWVAEISKNSVAEDVFFQGRDPDTLVNETYQLTRLGGTDQCGKPYIDDTDDYSYLFVLCTTGGVNKELALLRYDLDSYLDDALTPTQITVADSVHEFSGDIFEQALVVSASNNVAYARDASDTNNFQDVYLNGSKIKTTTSGVLKSLAISSDGTKLVYVLDNTAYLYSGVEMLITSEGVNTVDISADGTLIVFDSTSNTLVADSNSDSSPEIFTVPAVVPFTGNYLQKTNLAGGECKLPSLSETAQRLVLVCNQDLLSLGNNFTNREAVFVIETLNQTEVVHLISPLTDAITTIKSLLISSDGANVIFEDGGDEENAFTLLGMAKLDSKLEEGTEKNYPIPFDLPGDGENGILFYLNSFLLMLLLVRKNNKQTN